MITSAKIRAMAEDHCWKVNYIIYDNEGKELDKWDPHIVGRR